MFFQRAGQPLFWGLLAAATLTMPAMAQSVDNSAPLGKPTVSEALDKATEFNSIWKRSSIADDAKWVFGFDYGDVRLEREAKRFNLFSTDLLKQQNEGQAIIRTQDISNLFETSLRELNETGAAK
ncbi:MAG: hypothetical protein MH252_11680 [Thermosynechococcaceae cyanobacterium MS004]|nr:hypothetical protein [Thermosynechococcaceae cyanobacterium MS004]